MTLLIVPSLFFELLFDYKACWSYTILKPSLNHVPLGGLLLTLKFQTTVVVLTVDLCTNTIICKPT